MSQLLLIKERINLASNLQKVVNALELVTETKVNKIRSSAACAKSYLEKFTELFNGVHVEPSHRPKVKTVSRIYVISFFSQKGFCGSFNSKLTGYLQAFIKTLEQPRVYLIGRKNPKLNLSHLEFVKSIEANEQEYQIEYQTLFQEISEVIWSGEKIELYFVYNQLVSLLQQDPAVAKIYPLAGSTKPQDLVLCEPSLPELWPGLLQGYLSAWFEKIYWESLVGENYSRLLSMKNASDNATQILEDLHLDYNKTRQSKITQDLSEIFSAFGVLKKAKLKRIQRE